MLINGTNYLFPGTPRVFALDVEASLVEWLLKEMYLCLQKKEHVPARNCFVQTNSTKQQLIFSIPNVLGSFKIQIEVMTNTQILWRSEIETFSLIFLLFQHSE